MAGDSDVRLTGLAAEILHDAIQVYSQGDMERWLISSNPVLSSWQVGMFAAADAHGAFPASRSGSSAIHGLRTTLRIPPQLPALRLPRSRELASQARSAPLLAKLAALAAWAGPRGKPVPATDKLSPADAADAAHWTGVPPRELPYLWEYALASWWLELGDDGAGRAWGVPGEIAARWADGDDSGALHVWAVVFAAVLAQALNVAASLDPGAADRLSFEGQGVALAVRLFLDRQRGLPADSVTQLVMDGAVSDSSSPRARRAWDAWVRAHGDPALPLLTSLTDLGGVFVSESIGLTPLALWALREQLTSAGVDVPLLPASLADMTAADLVALAGGVSEERFRADTLAWAATRGAAGDGAAGRGPERAARDLLDLAAAGGPQARLVAVRAVRHIGAAAAPAWRSAMRRPELRAYARIAL